MSYSRETNFYLHDRYIWYKKSSLPSGRKFKTYSRLDDKIEYIFHFVKTKKNFKSNVDDVREPYAEISKKRFNSKLVYNHEINDNGFSEYNNEKKTKENDLGKVPETVFRFNTTAVIKGYNHPAAFHEDLSNWFIKYLTDIDDVVLDPFMGSGTVAISSLKLKRKWIGFEINTNYFNFVNERIKNFYGLEFFIN